MLSSINPVIATVRINIQAVTACNRDRFFRIILRKLPSPLPPLSKGGGLTAWHKPLLYSVLLAIPPPFLFTELFCRQDGGIALRQHNYFNRRNLERLTAARLFYKLLLRVTPPFRYSANSSDNSKGGIVCGDSPLSCRGFWGCLFFRLRTWEAPYLPG